MREVCQVRDVITDNVIVLLITGSHSVIKFCGLYGMKFEVPIAMTLKIQFFWCVTYEGHLESKERFAIKKYLLIIGKKKNMQVLSHTFTYFST